VAAESLWFEAAVSHISRKTSEIPPSFLRAALDKTACAPFFKERRMEFVEPTKLHRKSGIWGTPSSVAGMDFGIGCGDGI
jgi:hypothetical protein